jgi:hypothetical protein
MCTLPLIFENRSAVITMDGSREHRPLGDVDPAEGSLVDVLHCTRDGKRFLVVVVSYKRVGGSLFWDVTEEA